MVGIQRKSAFGLLGGLVALLAVQTAARSDVGCTPESWSDVIRTPHSDAEWVEMLRAARSSPSASDCFDVALAALAVHLKMLDPSNAEARFRSIVNRVGSTP